MMLNINILNLINKSFSAFPHAARGETFLSLFILYPLRGTSATRGTLCAMPRLESMNRTISGLFLVAGEIEGVCCGKNIWTIYVNFRILIMEFKNWSVFRLLNFFVIQRVNYFGAVCTHPSRNRLNQILGRFLFA